MSFLHIYSPIQLCIKAKNSSKLINPSPSLSTSFISISNSGSEIFSFECKAIYLISCIEMALAQEYKVINFDFYNDWVNGVIYMPRWMRFVRGKRTYLFGLIKIKPKVKSCMDDSSVFGKTRYYTQQCALSYSKTNNKYTKVDTRNGCMSNNVSKKQKCHKNNGFKRYGIFGSADKKGSKGNGGIVHQKETMLNQYVYYFKPCEWKTTDNKKTILFVVLEVCFSRILYNHVFLFYSLDKE